jgi:hypothetical protein
LEIFFNENTPGIWGIKTDLHGMGSLFCRKSKIVILMGQGMVKNPNVTI